MVGPVEATFAIASFLLTVLLGLGGIILYVIAIVALWRLMKAQEASVALLREITARLPGGQEARRP
jgi:hypothetical protein